MPRKETTGQRAEWLVSPKQVETSQASQSFQAHPTHTWTRTPLTPLGRSTNNPSQSDNNPGLEQAPNGGLSPPQHTKRHDYQYGCMARHYHKLQINVTERVAVQLGDLGLADEKIEKVLFGTDVRSPEEALAYLMKNPEGLWDHHFVKTPKTPLKDYCLMCLKPSSAGFNLPSLSTPTPKSRQVMPKPEKAPVEWVRAGYVMNNRQYQAHINKQHNKSRMHQRSSVDSSNPNLSLGVDKQQFNTSFLSTSQPTESLNDRCLVCGDPISAHNPDYNVEYWLDAESSSTALQAEKERQRIALIVRKGARAAAKQAWNTIERPGFLAKCGICLELRSMDDAFLTIPCGHLYCHACIKEYFMLQIKMRKALAIKCPSPDCGYQFALNIITDYVGYELIYKFYCQREELRALREKKLLFCPRCGFGCQKVPPEGATVAEQAEGQFKCDSCGHYICLQCGRAAHVGLSCAEAISLAYHKLARGRPWQACPVCKAPVLKARLCGHMMCDVCLLPFCAYCRKPRDMAHNERTELEVCSAIRRPSQRRSKKKPVEKSCCLAVFIFCLYVLMLPLLALLAVPYIVGIHVYDWMHSARRLAVTIKEVSFSMGEHSQSARDISSILASSPVDLEVREVGEGGRRLAVEVPLRSPTRCRCTDVVAKVTVALAVVAALVLSPVAVLVLLGLGLSYLLAYLHR